MALPSRPRVAKRQLRNGSCAFPTTREGFWLDDLDSSMAGPERVAGTEGETVWDIRPTGFGRSWGAQRTFRS